MIRAFPLHTLRGRLAALVCLATLPAFLFVFYVATKERVAVLHRVGAESVYVAELASREHAHQVLGARRLLDRLAALPAAELGRGRLPQLLPIILRGFPQFANLGVLDLDGRVVFSSVPPPPGVRMAGLTVFQQALRSREVVVGSYLVGLIVGRPILIMAKALRTPQGEPRQVLFAALDLAWLDELAVQAGLPTDNALFIVDRHGTVLASSLGARLPQAPGNRIEGFRRLSRHPRILADCRTPDGVKRLAVASPLQGANDVWVVVGPPRKTVHSLADSVYYRDIVVLALLAILAVTSSLVATDVSVLRDLRRLAAATRRFGAGEYGARVPVPPPRGEIRTLALTFNSMADNLEARHRDAVKAQERLRALSHRLQTAREAEAARIAQELHDGLGQELSVLRLEVGRLRRKAMGERQAPREELAALIEELGEPIDQAVRSVRRISSELRPGVLDRLGLVAGLEWLVNEFSRRTGIAARLSSDGVEEKVDAEISTALFRITQEALSNVARHAGATEVSARLSGSSAELRLRIEDNGRGFDSGAEPATPSLGLLGMKERARRLGGSVEIAGTPGRGTVLMVGIPRVHPGAGAEGSEVTDEEDES